MSVILSIIYSFVGSAFVFLFVLYLYYKSASHVKKEKAYAECWWLPAWNCFRFVLRNMHADQDLYSIQFHSWLRTTVPSKPGSSVNSFLDVDLTKGERIVLASGQDLPLLCFRFKTKGRQLTLVNTDKFGKALGDYKLTSDTEDLKVQYQLKVENLGITHEVTRVFVIPHEIDNDGKKANLFRQLFDEQAKPEHKLKLVFKTSEIVTIPTP